MKILHYSLGFPPYRTGGLTKFCMDLMITQQEHGHEVGLLWPGQMGFIFKKTHIRESIDKKSGLLSYEIINPLPVPLDEGIKDIEAFTVAGDVAFYKKWFMKIKPDIIHIHTLMGLHKEVILAAKECNIRTVFTTHDYFGLCPKVTLYKYGYACEDDKSCMDCIACNQKTLSVKKIILMQSPLYRRLKNFTIVKVLRKSHRQSFFEEETELNMEGDLEIQTELAGSYKNLRKFYIKILSEIDMIHFNSKITENIYNRFIYPKASKIITITHKDIWDNRQMKNINSEKLRLTYLAPTKPYKGFNVIKAALDELWNEGNRLFELKLFTQTSKLSPYMKVQEDGFKYKELKQILTNTDVLLAPSIWYETFGFTVLEAISHGVPVIVSDHVGAKDIIGEGGIVVEAGSVKSLKETISKLDKKNVEKMKEYIHENIYIKTWDEFLDENYALYKK